MGERHHIQLAILQLLDGRELSACELAGLLSVKRPALSHHLGCLAHEGLVRCRPEGARRFYSLPTMKQPMEPPSARSSPQQPESPFAAAFKRIARERGLDSIIRKPSQADHSNDVEGQDEPESH